MSNLINSNPKRITFSQQEIINLIREAAIKKVPELEGEEFEIEVVWNSYNHEATAIVHAL